MTLLCFMASAATFLRHNPRSGPLSFPLSIPVLGKSGEMLKNRQESGSPPDGMTLLDMTRRPSTQSHFDSMRAGIGSALRSLHSHMLGEPPPNRIAELLMQLDELLRQLDWDDGTSCR